jgi:hypothetical protein
MALNICWEILQLTKQQISDVVTKVYAMSFFVFFFVLLEI